MIKLLAWVILFLAGVFPIGVAFNHAVAALAAGSNAEVQIAGSIQENVYTNPSQSFRVRVPKLLVPGARIKDGVVGPGGEADVKGWGVEFSDDLCRGYFVHEWQGSLGNLNIENWTKQNIVSKIIQGPVSELTTRVVQTRYGTAVIIHYQRGEASPCVEFNSPGSPQVRPSAEFSHYLLYANGHFYHLGYILGETPGAEGIGAMQGTKISPADQVLDQFFAGFEILGR